MTIKTFVSAAALLSLTGLSQVATAGDDKVTLDSWVEGANQTVDKVMYYPHSAIRFGATGKAVYRVTIDNKGDVVNFSKVQSAGNTILDTAAKAVIRRADFPSIPDNFGAEEMTFKLALDYQLDSNPFKAKRMKQGNTDVHEVASAKSSRSQFASIEIEMPAAK